MSLIDKIKESRFLRTAIAAAGLTYLVSCGSGSSNSNSNYGDKTCVPEWSCGEYGECQPDERQYRTCTDLNSCDPSNNTKTTSRDCIYDPCKEGECTVIVGHDGLVALAFYYQDRNNNGIDDIDEWAENISTGCIENPRTNGCDRFIPSDWITGFQRNINDNINSMEFDGNNNKVFYHMTDGQKQYIRNIPDANSDNLINIARLY